MAIRAAGVGCGVAFEDEVFTRTARRSPREPEFGTGFVGTALRPVRVLQCASSRIGLTSRLSNVLRPWSVDEVEGWWWLTWLDVFEERRMRDSGSYFRDDEIRRRVKIMPKSAPWTLAVDAACDFMQSCLEDKVPSGCASPEDFMGKCVHRAVSQR